MRRKNIESIIIYFLNILVVFFIGIGVLPIEANLFLAGILVFYFLFAPLVRCIYLFICLIPLFIALPITENFDSMSIWRILLVILFLRSLFTPYDLKTLWSKGIKWSLQIALEKIKEEIKLSIFILVLIFLLIGAISIIFAPFPIAGIKKLLYFINIFMLYFVIKWNIVSKSRFLKVLKSIVFCSGVITFIGFFQFILVFFIPLYTFWQFWAKNIIPIFYGKALSSLLSYSNTWFSYYKNALPTLRMFSVFPDSHSFGLFLILSIPALLTLIFYYENFHRKTLIIYNLLFAITLLGIILSGSRGIWISVLVPLSISLICANFSRISRMILKAKINISVIRAKLANINKTKIPKMLLASFLIFLFLFPVSSLLLSLSQRTQGSSLDSSSDLVFERAKTITDFSEISAKSRLEILSLTISSILKHPLLGVGLGNYPIVLKEDISAAKKGASAHNLYLDICAEMGIFALFVLIFIFYLILKKLWTIYKENSNTIYGIFAISFMFYFIWVLSYNLFDVVLLNDKVFLLFVAILGLVYSYRKQPERVSPLRYSSKG